jgi:hypothetical protein
MSALEALEALIKVIKSHQLMSIEMVLANESNKKLWPFAFVTAGNKSDSRSRTKPPGSCSSVLKRQ